MEARKQAIIEALQRFANQRGGIDPRNYGDWKSYRQEARSVTKDLHDARTLWSAVSWRDSITADDLIEASKHAYSGRLTLKDISAHYDDGSTLHRYSVSYCTDQYFPTEYRKAVCAVLASALWSWQRANMPAPNGKITRTSGVGPFAHESEHDNIEGKTPGDWLRSKFRKEFGRSIASGYFN